MKGGRGKEEWKWVKRGEEVERLPTIDRSTKSRRPVDELFVGKTKGEKKRKKGKGKVMGEMGAAWDVKGC